MGKTFLGILATTVACSLGVAGAAAAGSRCGRNYVDANSGGTCDYTGSTCIYADADGYGVCDHAAGTCVYGDADEDGFCDFCGGSHGYCGTKSHHGSGSRRGSHHGGCARHGCGR